MTDETQETPEASEETSEAEEAGEDTEATPVAEPTESAEPDATAKPKRERSYLRVPMWAAAAIGVIVLVGGGFALGRVTAPDDNRVDVRAAGVPTQGEFPGFREINPDQVPRAVARAFFGVSVEAAANGVSVIRVSRGSPAEQAGLRDGDIITKVDGKAVATPAELAELIHAHDPGDEATITYTRDGSLTDVKVRLDDRLTEASPSN